MANPESGELALPVGDRVYKLVTDFAAIRQIEQYMSKEEGRIVSIGECYWGAANKSWRHIHAIAWGAFQRFHPDVTPEKADDIITELGGPLTFLKIIRELRDISEPEGSARPRKARQSKKAGATTTSTPDASNSRRTTSGG
jgi:hypothetical protein